MRSLLIVCIAIVATSLHAQIKKPEITDGTVLVYKIKEGKKEYKYTVTVTNGLYDNIAFSWKTDGAKPRQGTVEPNYLYDDEVAEDLLVTGFKDDEERLEDSQIRLFSPASLMEKIDATPEDIDFLINSKAENLKLNTEAKASVSILVYNKKWDIGYTELATKKGNLTLGIITCSGVNNLLSFYKDGTVSMELISISADATASKEKSTQPAVKAVTGATKKMDAAKFAVVKNKFPVLAMLEDFDPTKNATIAKPFVETYEYRIKNGENNPPSLIDCLVADLQILYNRKNDYEKFTGKIDGNIAMNYLPTSVSEKLFNVYLKDKPGDIVGYRPWTNSQFIQSLSAFDRGRLTFEIEAYVKQFGILGAK